MKAPNEHWLLIKEKWPVIEKEIKELTGSDADMQTQISSLRGRVPNEVIASLHELRMARNQTLHVDAPLPNAENWGKGADAALHAIRSLSPTPTQSADPAEAILRLVPYGIVIIVLFTAAVEIIDWVKIRNGTASPSSLSQCSLIHSTGAVNYQFDLENGRVWLEYKKISFVGHGNSGSIMAVLVADGSSLSAEDTLAKLELKPMKSNTAYDNVNSWTDADLGKYQGKTISLQAKLLHYCGDRLRLTETRTLLAFTFPPKKPWWRFW